MPAALKRLTCLLVLLAASPARAEFEDWASCRTDADCMIVGSICPNFYWAINRHYVFANAARNALERGGTDCAVSFQPRPEAVACRENRCTMPLNQTLTGQLAE